MSKTASPETKTEVQLPKETSTQTFTVNGQSYLILRYAEGKGPTLAQTIEITAKSKGKEMLTIDEARKIKNNGETNNAFKEALKVGEWTYIRDPRPEKRSLAACLGRNWGVWLNIDYVRPDDAARVVVLKETGREAAAPKVDPKLLARAESSVAKLDAAEQVGVLAQGITEPLRDLLRILK